MSLHKERSLLLSPNQKKFQRLPWKNSPRERSVMKSPRPRVKKQRLSKSLSGKKILLIVSGSIAAYKTGDLIHDLKTQGASVTCVMTECAKHFVTPLVLRALSGHKVYEDFFS